MSALSPAELITQSFYAWEIRGRGWQLADYPVSLEPPFRPCFVLPSLRAEVRPIDDGKRPTFLSSLVDGFKLTFGSAPARSDPPDTSFEEPLPYPAPEADSLVAFRISVPSDHQTSAEVSTRLLIALSATLQPVSLEIIGHEERVILQIVCADVDREHVAAQLFAYLPNASIIEHEDLLASAWNEACEHCVVDLGLSQEFFLPLHTTGAFKLDPYLSLVPALALAKENELVIVQILFQGIRNAWGKAIRNALDDGQGGCIIADGSEFLSLAREKLKTPLFAVAIRVATQGGWDEPAWELARSTNAFFLQYARPGSNEFIPLDNDGYPDNLHEQAVLLRQSFRTGILLSADELAALVHMPDASLLHPALVRDEKRTKAPPAFAHGHPFALGENLHRGKQTIASIAEPERLQHTWVVGASGTGKSTLLLNLIEEDITLGYGVAVLDPHGDLIDDVLARIPEDRANDVVLFDPADTEWPVGFNIFSAQSEGERTLLASDLVGIFRRFSTSWGDTMGTVLGNAVLAILEHPRGGTLLDLRRLLVDEAFRRSFLQEVEDEEVRFFWAREYPLIGSRSVGPILTRLDTFLRPKTIRHIVGQREGKLHLSEIMATKKIFLAKLSHGLIGEENAYLLGSLLVGKFLGLALARQELAKEERAAFFLYADEFQHFLTPSVETLLTAVRKYALGTTLAHQTLAQLRESAKVEGALFGNAYTRIVFRTGESDAKKLSEGFSGFDSDDILHLGRGEALVRLGSSGNDFNLMTFPASPVADDEAKRRRSALIALSRQRYAVPLADLKTRFRDEYGSKNEAEAPRTPVVVPEPEALSPPPLPPSNRTGTGKAESPPKERSLEPPPLGRGGQEHKYLQHLVKRLAEERGFRAVIEDGAGEGRVDVALSKEHLRIAIEVSITTDPEHEAENLKKCQAAGFGTIVFIVPDKRRREKLKERFKDLAPSVPVIAPEEVVATLEILDTSPVTTESAVRGYKVKVTRQAMSPEALAGRRATVAQVIARSLAKQKT